MTVVQVIEQNPFYVYEVQGWFGDCEWSEGIFLRKEDAEALTAELWKTRTSPTLPENHWCQKLCKFDVVEREVIGS